MKQVDNLAFLAGELTLEYGAYTQVARCQPESANGQREFVVLVHHIQRQEKISGIQQWQQSERDRRSFEPGGTGERSDQRNGSKDGAE